MTEHEWRAPDADEPREAGGVCVHCGAYANFEAKIPCSPDEPAWIVPDEPEIVS